MAYTVGEVEVNVFPNAQEFYGRLQGQVGPQADKLGQQIGDTLAKQIAQGIRKGLGDFPSDNPAKDPAKRKGDEAAGAFGDAFKARLRAAMADLPDIKIGADSSAADRALAAVRADMESLHDARIGIDLSDTEALAKLDELKAKLAEIGASSDSVRVKVDTAAATAELVRFQAELDKINGETATAKVKVDDGGGLLSGGAGISSLTGALMTVAPAIVPIGAAAISGGMALGTMAAAGAGAAGVLVVAFKGVGDAVKLLGQQQTQQAAADSAAGAGAAQRAQAIVSAQRQMTSAQMSLGDAQRNAAQQEITDAQAVASAQTALGDARRNAANQQITDAQAVVSAQQSLAQANDQVTLAQKALTDAQEAGRRELESFANNAADASLAQRQAAISLETTQATAAKTMASSTATDLQKRQAALDVAKAQQALTEANQRVTESAKDNTKAQDAGLSGTQAVVSAQKQVTTAQQTQQKATQTLADAQRKASQDQITSQESIAKAAQAVASAEQKSANDRITSHESIVRAQQAVAAAADAMAAAQKQSAGTTNAALSATNAAIAKLDPATRNFAEYLRGTWAPIWDKVQHAAAGGLLPGVQAGMDALIPVMPAFTGIVGALAKAMGDLFAQAGQALQSPFWTNFFQMIQQNVGPLLGNLGHIIGDIATGFAGIIQAFMPMSQQISGGLADLAGKFATWGQNLASNPGFLRFVQYVQDSWPKIQQIIENVATAVGHIVEGGANLGGGFLSALETLSGVLASLPVPVVEALVAAFIGLKVTQTIASPIDGLAGSLKKIGGMDGAVGVLGKVAGSLPLIGIALGAAVPLIPAFLDFLKGAPGPAEAAAAAIKDIGTELSGTNGVIDDTVRKTMAQKLQTMGLLDTAKEWGVSAKTMTDAALGNADAIAVVTAAAGKHKDAIAQTGKTYGDFNGYVETATKATDDQLTALTDLGGGVKDQVAKQGELSTAVYGSKAAADAMSTASDSLKDVIKVAGDHMTGTWNNNTAVLTGATDDQIKKLGDLGFTVTHLPNGQVVVNTDTGPARQQMQDLIDSYKNYSVNINPQGMAVTTDARNKLYGADGGIVEMYANGGIRAMGGDIAQVVKPGTLRVIGDNPVADEAFIPLNNSTRSHEILSQAAQRMGRPIAPYADGGINGGKTWNMYLTEPVKFSDAYMAAAKAAIAAQFATDLGPAISAGKGGVTWPQLDAIRRQLFPGSVLTSAYRPGANDYHGLGEAIDIGVPGNLQSGLMPIAATLARLYPNSTELIHNPNGSIKNGHPVAPSFWGPATWAEHANHVHWAMTPSATAATRAGLAAGGVPTDPMGNVALGLKLATQRGWGDMNEWTSLYKLWERESGWNNVAQNRSSTAYGIPQFLDGTWATVGARKTSDAATQINAGLDYIAQRFHDPIGAWAHEQAVGWYDHGGLVPPGYHMLYNGTGGNEVIAPQQTFREVVNQMHSDAGGGSGNYTVIAQFGNETIQATAVRVVDDALGDLHNTMHYAGG